MTLKKHNLKIPLVFKLLIPLIFGVIIAFYTDFKIGFNLVLFFFFLLFVLTIPVVSRQVKIRSYFGFFTGLFFFCLGNYLVEMQTNNLHEHYFFTANLDDDEVVQVRILDEPEEKENSIKCFANVEKIGDEKCVGKVLLYFQKSEESQSLNYGDIICFQARFQQIKPNGNPKEFDYSRYLKINDIIHQAYIKNEVWQKVGEERNQFYEGILEVRSYLDGVLTSSGLENSELMVAKALILGEKESLDRETLRTYSSAGAMHVLAVSGLHVGIVMLIFSFFLKPIKRLPKGKLVFICSVIALIWFYALVTGMSSSVLRATVMFSFVIIGKEMERETSVYQSIFVSAFILILIEPLVIFQVGFQLSYLAVIGIVYLQPKIYNLFYTKYKILDKVWQISSVSIAAQLATFPLGLYYFHQFPNFFMISNLIVIPLAFAILIVGMVYFLVIWIPVLNLIVFEILNFLLRFLNIGVKWVEELPYSIYWGVSIEWYEVFWLYLILVLGALAFIYRRAKMMLSAMGAVVVLLIYNVGENYVLQAQNQVVIYNVNKSVAIDFFYGRDNRFFADEALYLDEDKLLFHVKHNWFYRTGKENPSSFVPLSEEKDLMRFGNELLFLCSDENLDSIPQTSLVYLQNISFIPNYLMSDFKSRQVKLVIGEGVPYSTVNYLRKNLMEDQIHELKNDGAFIQSF